MAATDPKISRFVERANRWMTLIKCSGHAQTSVPIDRLDAKALQLLWIYVRLALERIGMDMNDADHALATATTFGTNANDVVSFLLGIGAPHSLQFPEAISMTSSVTIRFCEGLLFCRGRNYIRLALG
jgi:hypothetical protein